jgi:predicted phosphodiesterase
VRIAAISDIHGNLHALDAVLADIERRGVHLIVNLGDMLSGPLLPRETADRLMALDLPTIRGNHERQLLDENREGMGASDRYAADSITALQRAWLTALPAVLWAADDVYLCHATPESDVACFLEDILDGELFLAPLARIEERARTCAAPLLFCGHTHIPRVAHLITPSPTSSRSVRRTPGMPSRSAARPDGSANLSRFRTIGKRRRGSPSSAHDPTGRWRCAPAS